MTDVMPMHVAVLIVSYRGEPYLRSCLRSIADAAVEGLQLHSVVVDNASPDGTSSLVECEFPQVHLVQSAENRGFAGGNNLGWQYIQEHLPQVQYVMLLNQDATIGPKGIMPLVQFLRKHPKAGSVQPAIMLHDDPHLLNTAGNVSHYLGFGTKTGYRQHMQQALSWAKQIDFPSGCAVLLRADLLKKQGLFADDLFMYLEDAQLGWKLRMLGYENWYLPHTTVLHQYQFSSTLKSYEHLADIAIADACTAAHGVGTTGLRSNTWHAPKQAPQLQAT
jgi:GT2 family glycosyltransferase